MGWHYRPPANFPAVFLATLRSAAEHPNIPILLMSSHNTKDVEIVAERFRWFRWCIRQEPKANFELSNILENNDIRTAMDQSDNGTLLYVTAKPTKLSELLRLNPHLEREIISEAE